MFSDFTVLASNPCLIGDPNTYIIINAPMGSTTAELSDFISPNGPLPAGGGNLIFW